MSRYISPSEVAAFIGAKNDSTLEAVINGVEGLFDTLIASDTGLIESTKTEYHPITNTKNTGRIFYLNTHRPTEVTTVNGVAPGTINVNYTLTGEKLELAIATTPPTAFPIRHTIVYKSGYADMQSIPQDIKLVIKEMCGAVWNSRKWQGIASFKQDLLSVNYTNGSVLDTLGTDQKNHLNTIINKYRIFNIV